MTQSNILNQFVLRALGEALGGDEDQSNSLRIMCWPGLPIHGTEYSNPWSPQNPKGSQSAHEKFSRLVDRAPKLNPMFVPAGSIRTSYGMIMRATAKSDPAVGRRLLAARQLYDEQARASVIEVGQQYHPCSADPDNWWDPAASDLWTSTETELTDDSETTDTETEESNGVVTDERDSEQSDANELQASYKHLLVSISRGWLDDGLFATRGWSIPGMPSGAMSNGRKEANPGSFPLLTTSFVLVKELDIRGKWTESDSQHASQIAAALSNAGGTHAAFDGKHFSVPGTMLIGWTSTLLPLCPPQA